MLDKKIAFIGSGAMAEAMISGLLRQKLARPEDLRASDTRPERVQELHEKYGVQPFTDNNQAAEHADVVVLSVKPQRLTEVLGSLKGAIPPGAAGAFDRRRSDHREDQQGTETQRCRPLDAQYACPDRRRASPSGSPRRRSARPKKRPPAPSWVPSAKRSMWMTKITSTWPPPSPAPVRLTFSSSWKP